MRKRLNRFKEAVKYNTPVKIVITAAAAVVGIAGILRVKTAVTKRALANNSGEGYEHGRKTCGRSPSIPEEALHDAIMSAVSEAILRKPLLDAVTESVRAAACADTDAAEYQAARQKMTELKKMADKAIFSGAQAHGDEDFYDEQYKKIMDEHARYQKIAHEFEARDSIDRYTERQVTEAAGMLANEPLLLSEYDDQVVRQLVDTVRVLAKDRIIVTLKGGLEIGQNINI